MGNLRRYFITGLVVFLPVALTIYLFILTINFVDGLVAKFIKPLIIDQYGFYVQGLGIIVGFALILIIGFFASNFFGKKLYGLFENLMLRLPFFRQVYPAIKEIALFLFSREKLAFKQVVLVEYPRKGIFSYGFVTNDTSKRICDKVRNNPMCNVFIPSAPGPLTGFVIMVPKKDVFFTDVTVEEAIKFNVSGGVVQPR